MIEVTFKCDVCHKREGFKCAQISEITLIGQPEEWRRYEDKLRCPKCRKKALDYAAKCRRPRTNMQQSIYKGST
jgi:hypothetical protein